jgi:hypothetical protein
MMSKRSPPSVVSARDRGRLIRQIVDVDVDLSDTAIEQKLSGNNVGVG